nr:MAG TPA: hypothetical protein [Caudoviricetes sp.]
MERSSIRDRKPNKTANSERSRTVYPPCFFFCYLSTHTEIPRKIFEKIRKNH